MTPCSVSLLPENAYHAPKTAHPRSLTWILQRDCFPRAPRVHFSLSFSHLGLSLSRPVGPRAVSGTKRALITCWWWMTSPRRVWKVSEAGHGFGRWLLAQPVTQSWRRWRLETIYTCGPQIQVWKLSSQAILAFESTFPGRTLATYNVSIIFHFKKKISPNLWPFFVAKRPGKAQTSPTSDRFIKQNKLETKQLSLAPNV